MLEILEAGKISMHILPGEMDLAQTQMSKISDENLTLLLESLIARTKGDYILQRDIALNLLNNDNLPPTLRAWTYELVL